MIQPDDVAAAEAQKNAARPPDMTAMAGGLIEAALGVGRLARLDRPLLRHKSA
jgi:predicted lipid-binding transport protein (Tim44 family)